MNNNQSRLSMQQVRQKKWRLLLYSFRLIFALTIVLFFSFMVLKSFFIFSSEQAVINTKIISLRSPIAGNISIADITPGTLFPKDYSVFQVKNPRFGNIESAAQYNYLQNLIDNIESEIAQNSVYREKHELDYQRFQELEKIGGVSKRDFEEVENTLAVLNTIIENKEKQLDHLRQRFAEAERQLNLQKECTVLMPGEGVIWAIVKKNGVHVNANDEIIQIIDPGYIWVDAFFSEKYAKKLRPGITVTVREIGSKRKWKGTVIFIRAGIDRVTYNAPVAIPPQKTKKRLIVARIKVNWDESFTPAEFHGVGRSVVVTLKNNSLNNGNKK